MAKSNNVAEVDTKVATNKQVQLNQGFKFSRDTPADTQDICGLARHGG